MKNITVIALFFVFLYSCSALNPRTRDFYQRGYRTGMEHAMKSFKDNMDKANPVHTWQPPVVEKVWIPGRLQGSIFVPGHEEWVLVRPGQWELRIGPVVTRSNPSAGKPLP